MSVILDNKIFRKSTRENKKYDVFNHEGKYITSFGDKRYSHYFDRIGLYSHLNHKDENRRRSYRNRHKNDHINDDTKAGYYSWRYLW